MTAPTNAVDLLAQFCEAALLDLPYPVILSDRDTLLFANNSAVLLLRGSSRAEFEGRPALSVLHPDVHAAAIERRALLIRGQALPRIPVKLVALDGATIVTTADIRPVVYGDQRVTMLLFRNREVPAINPAVRSLAPTSLFVAALEAIPEAILLHDAERILFVNSEARRVLRADPPENLVGRPIQTIVHPDGYTAGTQRRKVLLDHGQQLRDLPIKLIALDGTVLYATGTGILLHTPAGPAVLVMATFQS